MEETTGDHSLLFIRVANRLLGVSGTYVDDIIRASADRFLSKSFESTQKSFIAKETENLPLVLNVIATSR